jgi:acetylornithine deacetylase
MPRAERLHRLFLDLVGIYSPSGKEEEALAFLRDFCAEQGCPFGVQPVDEDRYNLVLGRSDAPLVFVGHVDTVAAQDLEEIGPEELPDGWVRGLGTADMKGGCAALVEAYLGLRGAGLGSAVGVALLVGEEEEGDGARAFLAEARPGRAVMAEPTALALCAGHYGYLEVALSARGRRAHASIPERGENAAEAVLLALQALLDNRRDSEGLVFSVRHFATSDSGFAVPESASAWVDVHLPPEYPVARAKEALARCLEDRVKGRVTVSIPTAQDGFSVPAADPLVAAYRSVGRTATDVFRSHSDANSFHAAGVPTVVLGPGRLEYAHAQDERVDFGEVLAAARLYGEFARAFLSLA